MEVLDSWRVGLLYSFTGDDVGLLEGGGVGLLEGKLVDLTGEDVGLLEGGAVGKGVVG